MVGMPASTCLSAGKKNPVLCNNCFSCSCRHLIAVIVEMFVCTEASVCIWMLSWLTLECRLYSSCAAKKWSCDYRFSLLGQSFCERHLNYIFSGFLPIINKMKNPFWTAEKCCTKVFVDQIIAVFTTFIKPDPLLVSLQLSVRLCCMWTGWTASYQTVKRCSGSTLWSDPR